MADNSLQALTTKIVQIADDTNKSIKPDVHAIKEAVCGGTDNIQRSIIYITRQLDNIQKKSTLNRLVNKNTGGFNNRTVIRNTNSISTTLNKILDQVKIISGRGSRFSRVRPDNYVEGRRKIKEYKNLSGALDIIERLRNIRLRDFIFTKRKIKNIRGIMSNFLKSFRMFKNQKEVDGTLNFANSSIDLMKKLSKVALISKPAQIGVKAIQKIFLGGKRDIHNGGLIAIFRKISKNERHIRKGKKAMKDILSACGSMFLTSIILTGLAVVAIPAMAGALLMKGIIWLLTGTFIGIGKLRRPIRKGSLAMLLMSASVITFALGLGLMMKAVRDMKLKDVGLMMASIAGIGLTVAGVGLLAVPIAIGSASLLFLGASLGVFGLAINAWRTFDVKPAMTNIKEAVGGLREIFGLELGKGDEKKSFGQRLTGGLMDIAMGVLNFGSSFLIMGQLLLAGAAIGLLYEGLKNWENFNGIKAANNLKIGIGALKDAFGLNDKKENKKESFKEKIKRFGGKVIDFGTSLIQGGKSLAEMGIITMATGLADVIRLTLIPWRKFDAKPAAKNLKEAFNALKDSFGLNDKNRGTGVKKIGKLFGNALDMANTLIDGGGVLANMGTIMIATGLSDVIRLNLKPWSNGDMNEPIKYLGEAIGSLKSIFGLDKEIEGGIISKALNVGSDLFDLASTLLQSGGVLAKMGTITLATGLAGKIRDYIIPWENYNGKKAIENIENTINHLLNVFNIGEFENEKEKSWWQRQMDDIKNIGKMFSSGIESIANIAEGGAALAKVSSIKVITELLSSIHKDLKPWENFNGLTNINKTLEGLSKISYIKIDSNFNRHLKSTIDTINALDMAKVSTVVELFKSFGNINDKPIDAFTKAVDKFSESCSDLIDSLNGFNGSEKVTVEGTSSATNTSSKDVNIINKEELAKSIADAIKSLPVNVRTDISDVKLVINNETGNRVVITLDN